MRVTLETLRARPKEHRQMIATLSSCAVMGVLLLGWGVTSIGMFRPNMPGDVSQTASAAASSNGMPNPVATSTDADAFSVPQSGVAAGDIETGTIVTIPGDDAQ